MEGRSHRADADTSIYTSMPSENRKHSGHKEGNHPFEKYPFIERVLIFEAMTKPPKSLITNTEERNLLNLQKRRRELLQTIFVMHESLESASRAAASAICQRHGLDFLKCSKHKDRSF